MDMDSANASGSGTASLSDETSITDSASSDSLPREVEKRLKDEVLAKLESGEWEAVTKEGRGVASPAWINFKVVQCATTKEFRNAVQCGKCKLVKLYKIGSSTSSLKRHKCPSGNQNVDEPSDSNVRPQATTDAKIIFRDASVQLCTGAIRPFSLFKGEPIKNFVQTVIDLGAKHGKINAESLISDPSTISRAVSASAKSKKTQLVNELLDKIKKGECAMTTDTWTDDLNNVHYTTVTLHWFESNWVLKSKILFTTKISFERETAENMKTHFEAEFNSLGITLEDLKNVVFVTDCGLNLVICMKLLGIERIYCSDHCLNIVLKRSFTLPLVDLDLIGESANTALQAASLAVTCIKTQKLDKDLSKALKNIPYKTETLSESESRVYKPLTQPLKKFLDKADKICNVLVAAGHENIASGIRTEELGEILKFMEPIEGDAKSHSNALDNADFEFLEKHIADAEEDSELLSSMKSTARAALASIDVLKNIQKCKLIVTLFKRWGIMKDLEISLKQENDTKWNSVLIMLQRFPRNLEKVNEHLSKRGRSELLLTEDDRRKISKLIAFLQEFKIYTEKLEADKKPTLQYVMPARIELLKHCQPVPDDSPGMKNIREKAKFLIEQKFLLSDHQKFAAFLWPKYRRLSKLPQDERIQIHKKISEKVAALIDKNDTPHRPPSPKRPKLDDEYSSWTESEEEEEGQADEVKRYLQDIPGEVTDLAQWWKEKGSILYPNLAKFARTIFCIPATSAPSERVFSTVGCVITKRRASLDPETVDHILFLNSWYKN